MSQVKTSGLLEVLALLLSHPAASDSEQLHGEVRELVAAWLDTEAGLLFLASSPHTGGLVRALIREGGEGKYMLLGFMSCRLGNEAT